MKLKEVAKVSDNEELLTSVMISKEFVILFTLSIIKIFIFMPIRIL